MLHADDSLEAFAGDMTEDIPIVDFTGPRFFAAGVIPRLKVTDLVPAMVDIGNQVSFRDLLMIDVKQNLARRPVHRAADQVGLWRFMQEETGVVGWMIQRFEHHR